MSLILDRLYYPGQQQAAVAWLWENKNDLFTPAKLTEAALVVAALLKYARDKVVSEDEGVAMTPEQPAEFADITNKVIDICEAHQVTVPAESIGRTLLIKLLIDLAEKLLDEWLKSQRQ